MFRGKERGVASAIGGICCEGFMSQALSFQDLVNQCHSSYVIRKNVGSSALKFLGLA